MAFISTIPEDMASTDVKQMYDKSVETQGYIPNYTKLFSHRPQLMAAWTNLLGSIRGNMDLRRRTRRTLSSIRRGTAANLDSRPSYQRTTLQIMLEKPDLEDDKIINCLQQAYGLPVARLTFLPLGADLNTAVYQAITHDETAYFVKLRRGDFDEAAVAVPKYLSDLGLKQIIPSLTTQTGQLWASLPPFKLILYPFVAGRDGYERPLSDQQWGEFGAALKQFHTAAIPPAITNRIKRETFSPRWRNTVKLFLARIEDETFAEPVATELAAFLQSKRAETLDLVRHTEQLAQKLQVQPPEFILCHADIHAWNLLIADDGALYMVDWDTLIFAPKERDLMFVGGGLGGNARPPQEEESLFYQGYGQTEINPMALTYYRCERIIEDIAVYCEQLLLSNAGGADRLQALENVKSNFRPNGTIAIALGRPIL